jgi:hypothetical protein
MELTGVYNRDFIINLRNVIVPFISSKPDKIVPNFIVTRLPNPYSNSNQIIFLSSQFIYNLYKYIQ